MELLIKIFEALEKFFKHFYGENSEIGSKISSILLLAVVISTCCRALWKSVTYLILKRDQLILNKNLTQYGYTNVDVLRATQYYIVPKYQNVSPTEDDEPGANYIASAKDKILPLFINKVFKKDKLDEKFFLILADSGMGKTSFMINLFITYKNKKGTFFSPFNYEIKLLPLGNSETFEKIKVIPNKENTILLLDAFDEDIKALDRHEERMDEIIAITKEFRFIVITCRTQFFPSDIEEPHRTKYFTFGDSSKEYKFQKIYLSAFDDNDIKKYLRKRFGLPFRPKYKKAKRIAEKSPSLVVRPLLLSYIEDLIGTKKEFETTSEIYEALIERWIEREASKSNIVQKYGSAEKYKEILYKFSENLAMNLYDNRKIRHGYYIDKNEKLPDSEQLQLSDFEVDYKFTETEKRSKSLLNRNSQGRYKFSHKSILEYFLALSLTKDFNFYANFDFEGMSLTKRFFDEIALNSLYNLLINKFPNSSYSAGKKTDKFSLFKIINKEDLPDGKIRHISVVEFAEIKELTIFQSQDEAARSINPKLFSSLRKLSSLWILDSPAHETCEFICLILYIKILLKIPNIEAKSITSYEQRYTINYESNNFRGYEYIYSTILNGGHSETYNREAAINFFFKNTEQEIEDTLHDPNSKLSLIISAIEKHQHIYNMITADIDDPVYSILSLPFVFIRSYKDHKTLDDKAQQEIIKMENAFLDFSLKRNYDTLINVALYLIANNVNIGDDTFFNLLTIVDKNIEYVYEIKKDRSVVLF